MRRKVDAARHHHTVGLTVYFGSKLEILVTKRYLLHEAPDP
jgi:hypothetical protein